MNSKNYAQSALYRRGFECKYPNRTKKTDDFRSLGIPPRDQVQLMQTPIISASPESILE